MKNLQEGKDVLNEAIQRKPEIVFQNLGHRSLDWQETANNRSKWRNLVSSEVRKSENKRIEAMKEKETRLDSSTTSITDFTCPTCCRYSERTQGDS